MLHKDYENKYLVEKITGREPQGDCRQDDLISDRQS
jgi:hypothetical protein